ncbi:hypothetical protein AKJ16_DCAP13688, partial [Drosera capensis]
MLKVHTAVCDRTAAAGVLRELMGYMRGRDYGDDEGGLGIEGGSEGMPIKRYGAHSAAALIAARALEGVPECEWEKYAVTTLVDCRAILEPALLYLATML